MPPAVFALLLSLGCAPAQFNGPTGPFVVWVCPPVMQEAPVEPLPPPVEERET